MCIAERDFNRGDGARSGRIHQDRCKHVSVAGLESGMLLWIFTLRLELSRLRCLRSRYVLDN